MQNKVFSKILVLVILIIIVGGGYFAWQYFGAPEEEVKEEISTEKTDKPSVQVYSPNGGEAWKIGETYTVAWQSDNIEKVDITVVTTANDFVIAEDIDALRGSYSWTIPEFWKPTPEGEVLIPADKYTVQVGNCKLPDDESIDRESFDWVSFIEKIGEECNFDESDDYLTIVE